MAKLHEVIKARDAKREQEKLIEKQKKLEARARRTEQNRLRKAEEEKKQMTLNAKKNLK